MNKGKVVLGTMAGIAIGGILGILFAPEKGSITRQKIMDNGNDYVDELKSKYNDLADSIAEQMHRAQDFAQDMAENGKSELHDLQNMDHSDSKVKL
jgi:gas vesicle protein